MKNKIKAIIAIIRAKEFELSICTSQYSSDLLQKNQKSKTLSDIRKLTIEYIYSYDWFIENIIEQAKRGESGFCTLSDSVTQYTIDRLAADGFDVYVKDGAITVRWLYLWTPEGRDLAKRARLQAQSGWMKYVTGTEQKMIDEMLQNIKK